ncbi:hypothetical protein EGW08_021653 [Elysia chlorotica]|uniref:Uncharacterized protein n=1 Tax=Elysia chlorotica TaxID=188477 RepID=A0A3S1AX52_ELYCH|nr:hypothetical protein EGW08_021653 [Elysia chlorotica]
MLSTQAGGDGGLWRSETEEDPGFFVTAAVKQPPEEDALSWDASGCSSSSDEDDGRDVCRQDWRGRNNNYLMGCTAPPVPPVPPGAKNVSANKNLDDSFRGSAMATGSRDANKKVENTYRLEPKQGQVFVWYKARRPMVSMVDQLLDEFVYNVKTGPAVTRKLSEVIMKLVKRNFDWPRYKFVCHVTLAQLNRQGIMVADRSLWSTGTDNVASYTYKNRHIVCVVTFHGFYYE